MGRETSLISFHHSWVKLVLSLLEESSKLSVRNN